MRQCHLVQRRQSGEAVSSLAIIPASSLGAGGLLPSGLCDLRHPVAYEGRVYPASEGRVPVLKNHLGAIHEPEAAEDAQVSPLLTKKVKNKKNN